MPTRLPRINVVFDPATHRAIRRRASRDGASLSDAVRRLVDEAIELEEDLALARLAGGREKTFSRRTALRHDEVWGHLHSK